jgi:lysophospholipase L1-like esterase
MRALWAKLRNALLLLALSLLGLELALQAAHFALFTRADVAPGSAGGDRFRVLCIGESTTVGYPLPRSSPDTYPSMLQRRLEASFPGLDFAVVNRGLNAATSSTVVQRLPEWLERHRPHVVVAMLGANDGFYHNVAYENELPVRLLLVLQNLRSYRLLGLLRAELERWLSPTSPPATAPQVSQGAYQRILADYERAVALYQAGDLETAARRFAALRRHIEQQRVAAVPEAGGHAVSHLPGQLLGPYHEAATYLGAIQLRRGRPQEALRVYREAIAAEPELPILRFELATLYERLGRHREAEQERSRAEGLLARYVLRTTQENYRRIRDLVSEHGATLVAMQYPLRDVDLLKLLFVDREGVRFVDLRAAFARGLEESPYPDWFSDRFAGDFGHLTPKGNALLVENLLDQALREEVQRWARARASGAGGAAVD